MVTALAATEAPDVSIASELGSLLRARASIDDPRWRLDAVVWVVPAIRQLDIPMTSTRAALRMGVTAATCPAPLRDRLAQLLDDALAVGRGHALARLVDALWSRARNDAVVRGVIAALALAEHDAARSIAEKADRYLRPQVGALIACGYFSHHGGARTWPTFVGDLRTRCSETMYEPSLPLLIALVDAIFERGDHTRTTDAERILAGLPRADRAIGLAHLARLDPAVPIPATRGARLLLARSAIARGTLEIAHELLDRERGLFRGLGRIELARAMFDRGLEARARQMLRSVHDRQLALECDVLRAEMDVAILPAAGSRRGWKLPAWTEVGPPRVEVETRAFVHGIAMLARSGTKRSEAAALVRRTTLDRSGRRHLLEVFERRGLDPLDVDDALRAESIALRAERIATTSTRLPSSMMHGLHDEPVGVRSALDRALFDEGLALSAFAGSRRRVLIETARACLRAALVQPASPRPRSSSQGSARWCISAVRSVAMRSRSHSPH